MDIKHIPHAPATPALPIGPTKIVRLPLDALEFSTDVGLYTATDTLSPMRYKALQQFQIEFGFDISFSGVTEYGRGMKTALNKKDLYDAVVLHNNFLKGVTNLAQGRNYGMEVCALFFNLEGENEVTFNFEETVQKKMRDWEAAGIDAQFFFQRAADLVKGFREGFSAILDLFSAPL